MAWTCDRCGDTGVILVCDPDGSREAERPCHCEAGQRMEECDADDAHERAAAEARADEFAGTDGRDWT
jgi:hypothetical protein